MQKETNGASNHPSQKKISQHKPSRQRMQKEIQSASNPSNRDRRLDPRMKRIPLDQKILIPIFKNSSRIAQKPQPRQRKRLPRQLQIDLLQVIQINMAIPPRTTQTPHLQ